MCYPTFTSNLTFMELTKEYFDEKLNQLATKEELKAHTGAINQRFDGIEQRFEKQTTELKAYADEQTEKLAGIISNSFDEERQYLRETLDVTNRVKTLETDMQKIKEALHIR
jgi:hypothetical protein